MSQFDNLIKAIDKHLDKPNLSKRDKAKLNQAKKLLLSSNSVDYIKGLELAGKAITSSNLIIHAAEQLWNWLCSLF